MFNVNVQIVLITMHKRNMYFKKNIGRDKITQYSKIAHQYSPEHRFIDRCVKYHNN